MPHTASMMPTRAEFARTITEIEKLSAQGVAALSSLSGAEPRIIGWTGLPGAGKSSLLAAVALHRRQSFSAKKIGILAVDPSSPITGGALLGDRIRMDRLEMDDRVYIRSLASRNTVGGLAPSILRISRFLAANGYDEIHIETVGAGQNDVVIAEIADTTVVVSAPNTGDSIQALKAGILEIADVHCLNKSDLPGADRAAAALELSIPDSPRGWLPRLVVASAKEGTGIDALSSAIDAHEAHLDASGERDAHVRRRRAFEFEETVRGELMRRTTAREDYARLLAEVEARKLDPAVASSALIAGADR